MLDLLICEMDGKKPVRGTSPEIIAVRNQLRAGRFAVFFWRLGSDWSPERLLENELISTLCGDIENRKQEEVEFFANLGIRLFPESASVPGTEMTAMVFKKSGGSLRERKTEKGRFISRSKMDTKDFAFTRDIANNVWHLYEKSWQEHLLARFARLLSWQDETIGVFRNGRLQEVASKNMKIETNLVPMPEKYPYDFAHTNQIA